MAEPLTCDVCGQTPFKDARGLRGHKQFKHQAGSGPLQPATPGGQGAGVAGAIAEVDVNEMTEHGKVFWEVARTLGIASRKAAAVSNFVSQNVDMDNPGEVWDALKEWPELTPNERKRWWKSWCTKQGIQMDIETAARVLEEVKLTPDGRNGKASDKSRGWVVDQESFEVRSAQEGEEEDSFPSPATAMRYSRQLWEQHQGAKRQQGGKYAVLGTQVVAVEEAEEGMSFYNALQLARMNREQEQAERREELEAEDRRIRQDREALLSQPQDGQWGQVVGPLVTGVLSALDSRGNGNSEPLEALRIQIQGQEKEMQNLRMESIRTDFNAQLQNVQTQITASITALAENLKGLQTQKPPDMMAQIKEFMGLQDMFTARAAGEPTDPDQAWRRDRSDIVRTIRENFPDFIEAGREVAAATKAQAQSQSQRRVMRVCEGCGATIRYAADAENVMCPSCGASVDTVQPIPQEQPHDAEDRGGQGSE